jgi:enoyl-CoA hydratase/carnithine racemase
MTETVTKPTVLAESVGAIRIVTLNRPEKLNAADLDMQESLLACLESIAADPEARALILTGAGRAFSAGGDRELLRQIAAGELKQQDALAKVHAGTIRCMLGLSIPAIAAVSGPAVGYAAGLVAMCDIVIIGETGFLSDPHVKFGIQATTAVQLIWPRRTSDAIAREILMTGRQVYAEEAVRLGLANSICPTGEELAKAMEMAQLLASMPPTGIAETKRAFNEPLLREVEEMLASDG